MSSFTLSPFIANLPSRLCNPLSIARSDQDLVEFNSKLEQSLYTICSMVFAYYTWGIPHAAYEFLHWQSNVVVFPSGKNIVTVAIDTFTIYVPPLVITITKVAVSIFAEDRDHSTATAAASELKLMTPEELALYKEVRRIQKADAAAKRKELEAKRNSFEGKGKEEKIEVIDREESVSCVEIPGFLQVKAEEKESLDELSFRVLQDLT